MMMTAVFVMTALIALGVIGACIFAFFKRSNTRRRLRYDAFTDIVTDSRDASSMTSSLNTTGTPQEKD